jgi:hypothetical protein
MSEAKPGSLREVMPQTAEMVDWLRAELGKEVADAIVAKGRAGKGGFYMAEVGPDGVLREFGSTQGGQRAALVDGALQMATGRRS